MRHQRFAALKVNRVFANAVCEFVGRVSGCSSYEDRNSAENESFAQVFRVLVEFLAREMHTERRRRATKMFCYSLSTEREKHTNRTNIVRSKEQDTHLNFRFSGDEFALFRRLIRAPNISWSVESSKLKRSPAARSLGAGPIERQSRVSVAVRPHRSNRRSKTTKNFITLSLVRRAISAFRPKRNRENETKVCQNYRNGRSEANTYVRMEFYFKK